MAEIPPTNSKISSDSSGSTPAAESSVIDELRAFVQWCGKNPASAALIAAIVATLVFFFGIIKPFVNGSESAAYWAWLSWNEENELTHGWLVPLATIWLIWVHRDELRRAPKGSSNLGIASVGLAVVLFVLSVRCLQPRLALMSVPFLLYGSTCFLWGRAAGRIVLFPTAFLVFMIPVAALQQATFKLQFVITGLVGILTHSVGIGIQAVGTTLNASDGSFNFEVAEGCSGIRSLTAVAMLTAIFVHLTQDRCWKKLTIFFGSVLFAIVGNVCRIFTVVLVAKYYDAKFAGGDYHEYSGYISIAFAMGAMLLFSKLVNLNYEKLAHKVEEKAMTAATKEEKKPVTYDY
ncbi:MAG: exosortase/archaeosortase family protein [Verrucomicrobiota bacterium]